MPPPPAAFTPRALTLWPLLQIEEEDGFFFPLLLLLHSPHFPTCL